MKFFLKIALLIGCGAYVTAENAVLATDPVAANKDSKVVGFDDDSLTEGEIAEVLTQYGITSASANYSQARQFIIAQWVEMKMAARQAEDSGLSNTPEFKKQLKALMGMMLIRMFDQDVQKKAYESAAKFADVASKEVVFEVSVILLDEKNTAQKVSGFLGNKPTLDKIQTGVKNGTLKVSYVSDLSPQTGVQSSSNLTQSYASRIFYVKENGQYVPLTKLEAGKVYEGRVQTEAGLADCMIVSYKARAPQAQEGQIIAVRLAYQKLSGDSRNERAKKYLGKVKINNEADKPALKIIEDSIKSAPAA